MRGDKLVIHDGHRKAGQAISQLLTADIAVSESKYVVTIAGESGSGKSEIASVLAEELARSDFKSIILQQDDYFVYPPEANAEMRTKDISHVGISEVRLDLIDENLRDILDGHSSVVKPLVIFEEDRIESETLDVGDVRVVIVEGTYTTALKNVHRHVFIDQTYEDTRPARKRRAREVQDDFLETILKIEHEIISSHKPTRGIIVTKDYGVEVADGTER